MGGARLLTPEEVDGLSRAAFGQDGPVRMGALGQSCVRLAPMAGFTTGSDTKVLLAPLPADASQLPQHPLAQEKLMPVLGVVRSPALEHAIAVCELIPEHGGLGHTSAVYGPTRT